VIKTDTFIPCSIVLIFILFVALYCTSGRGPDLFETHQSILKAVAPIPHSSLCRPLILERFNVLFDCKIFHNPQFNIFKQSIKFVQNVNCMEAAGPNFNEVPGYSFIIGS
jgi:hypothetical protein